MGTAVPHFASLQAGDGESPLDGGGALLVRTSASGAAFRPSDLHTQRVVRCRWPAYIWPPGGQRMARPCRSNVYAKIAIAAFAAPWLGLCCGLGLWFGLWLSCTPARAQDGDFARKTVTIYIGNTAGGTYDLMGRLVARHLGRHLPGNPSVIGENMPGAGTLRAANYIYNVAPKNGTALGIVSETLAVEQALLSPAVQFDARKFTWIGRVAASNAVHIIWHTAKVASIEDAKRIEATVAGTGPGNLGEIIPTLLNAVIG